MLVGIFILIIVAIGICVLNSAQKTVQKAIDSRNQQIEELLNY